MGFTRGGVEGWGDVLGLTVFILAYLQLKKAPQEPPVVTKVLKNASVRTMRIIHAVFLATIVGHIFVAERVPRPHLRRFGFVR